MEAWTDFFTAQVAAAAALVGLLFVAISVNVTRILQFSWLPARAAQTITALLGALLEASLSLFPDAVAHLAADLTLSIGVLTYVLVLLLSDPFQNVPPEGRSRPDYRLHVISNVIASQIATLPSLIGTILIATASPAGYVWLAVGILLALLFGMYNSWILLIEILR